MSNVKEDEVSYYIYNFCERVGATLHTTAPTETKRK
jgi:hypothetical protein